MSNEVTAAELQQIRMSVMASMETGNANRARTIVNELEDISPAHAASLRMDVSEAYGIFI